MNKQAAFVGFVVSALVGVGVGYAVRDARDAGSESGRAAAPKRARAERQAAAPQEPVEIFKVPVGDAYQRGPDDALVTIVEFSDFQCPFCSRVGPTLDKIRDTYGDDVRVVFKHQPLAFHRQAPLASEYALAAGEQGKFWEMHDLLFENQKRLTEADLKRYAAQLDLDQAEIDAYIASGKGKKVIQADQALARKIGANGTPAFYINGEKLSGAQPYENFVPVIERAKKRAEAEVAKGTPRSEVYAKLIARGRDSAPKPPPRREPPPVVRQKLDLVTTTPKKGGAEPLVTIVEFSDFECPFCSRVNPTLKKVMETYGDDVQIRFRNQPLSFHQRALPAAKAALAAHRQGKFWEMHDTLFANQKALGDADLKRYAEEVGLDVAQFEADMNSPEVAKIIAKDQADAAKVGARGTPTLFANGVPIRGAQPFAKFKQVIDAEIALAKRYIDQGTPRAEVYAKVIAEQGGKEVGGAKAKPKPKLAKAPEIEAAAKPKAPAKPEPAGEPEIYRVPVGESHQKGPADALVTIVEFSDFQCPFCSRVNPTLKQVIETYGDDVRVAFKHNPLPFHRDAPLASEYALAAGEQGKFWEMHDVLFANQKALKEADLKRYAEELGLDQAKIDAYLASGKGKAVIKADQALAAKLGARGTPAFFINGEKLVGAQPFPNFQKVIDAAKARAEKKIAEGTAKDAVYAALIAEGRESAPPPPPRPAPPPETRQKLPLVETTAKKGAAEPLVTIVEFSDFQCPFCSRVNPTLDKVLETYGDDVQVRFRNLPLPFHNRAMPAAKAAVAAGMQGEFWAMHDKLFANQKALGDADLKRYAEEIGLDVAKFEADMNSDAVADIIAKDQADAGKYGARGTPTLFVNGIPVRGAQPFARFQKVIDEEIALAKGYVENGTPRSEVYAKVIAEKGGAAPKPPKPPEPPKPVEVDVGNAPRKGAADAPVQIVVFSDFQCPFCGRLNPTIAQVEETYSSSVAVAFKQFPLDFHKDAKPAAIASLAAHRQGQFWAMHDALFENQRELTREKFVALAKELGLEVEQFEKDLDDPELAAQVEADIKQGKSIGVKGTPATFINGRLVSGAQPFPAFKAVIDAELKKAD